MNAIAQWLTEDEPIYQKTMTGTFNSEISTL